MGENRDHWKLKKQMSDFMSDKGWSADTEVKIHVFDGVDAKDPYLTIKVDVLAYKNGQLFIGEIGSMTSLSRYVKLGSLSERFEHLELGREPYRDYYSTKWEDMKKIRFQVPTDERFPKEKVFVERLAYYN